MPSGTRHTSSRSRATCTSTSLAMARTRSMRRSAFGGTQLAVRTLGGFDRRPHGSCGADRFRGFHQAHRGSAWRDGHQQDMPSAHTVSTIPRARSRSPVRKHSGSSGSASQLPGGDLDRAENQRNVIKAIAQKGLSVQVLSDPGPSSTSSAMWRSILRSTTT